jgi:hypothetical protein
MKRFVFFILGIILFSSCQKSTSEIVTARQWKGGPLLGDWITFSDKKDGRYYVSNDTIYKNGKPEAIITSVAYKVDHYVMEVSSLDERKRGTYFDKGRTE